jgi:hypothetical protein
MNGSNSNASVQNSANAQASARKALRQKFGVREAAIPAVKAFQKGMNFDHPEIATASWILVRPDGRRTHANTYNGGLGKGTDYEANTFPLPAADTKEYRKIFKGYTEVKVTDCPIAVLAESVVGTGPAETAAAASDGVAPEREGQIIETPTTDVE